VFLYDRDFQAMIASSGMASSTQGQQQQHGQFVASMSSSANATSSSLCEAYVQSILASVPETLSFIKIVEKSSDAMDQDMEEEQYNLGDQVSTQATEDLQQYDIIEGFKVPVVNSSSRSQLRPPGVSRGTQETRAIADQMAKVTLSDSQAGSSSSSQQQLEQTDTTLARSLSSMSMDTQP